MAPMMNRFNNLSTNNKLIVGFGVALFLIFTLSALVSSPSGRLRSSSSSLSIATSSHAQHAPVVAPFRLVLRRSETPVVLEVPNAYVSHAIEQLLRNHFIFQYEPSTTDPNSSTFTYIHPPASVTSGGALTAARQPQRQQETQGLAQTGNESSLVEENAETTTTTNESASSPLPECPEEPAVCPLVTAIHTHACFHVWSTCCAQVASFIHVEIPPPVPGSTGCDVAWFAGSLVPRAPCAQLFGAAAFPGGKQP